MFQRWIAIADSYECERRGWEHCDAGVLAARSKQCRDVAPSYARAATSPDRFTVVISHHAPSAPKKRSDGGSTFALPLIEKELQLLPSIVHTIFIIVHGDLNCHSWRPCQHLPANATPTGLQQTGHVPVVTVHFPFQAIGNRFGPLRHLQTDAVLVLDDNILIDHRDLKLAFNTWQVNDGIASWTSSRSPQARAHALLHGTHAVSGSLCNGPHAVSGSLCNGPRALSGSLCNGPHALSGSHCVGRLVGHESSAPSCAPSSQLAAMART